MVAPRAGGGWVGAQATPRSRMTDTTLLAVVGVMTAALTVGIDMG